MFAKLEGGCQLLRFFDDPNEEDSNEDPGTPATYSHDEKPRPEQWGDTCKVA